MKPPTPQGFVKYHRSLFYHEGWLSLNWSQRGMHAALLWLVQFRGDYARCFVDAHNQPASLRSLAKVLGIRWGTFLETARALESTGLLTKEMRHGREYLALTDIPEQEQAYSEYVRPEHTEIELEIRAGYRENPGAI